MTKSYHPETKALHDGFRADPSTGSVAVPIYQTTAYQFESTNQASSLFNLSELGNIYSRIMHPTSDILEKRMSSIEDGAAALAASTARASSAWVD